MSENFPASENTDGEAVLPDMPPAPEQEYSPPPPVSANTSPILDAIEEELETGNYVMETANGQENGLGKCPACGSTDIRHRVGTSALQCLFCRHEWTEANAETAYGFDSPIADLIGTTSGSGATDIEAEFNNVVTLKCGACGAEVVVNTESSLQARCHWCRHVLSINEQIPNGSVPDAVLPFTLTKEQAIEKIHEFAGKRELFAHRKFKKEFSPENVIGVYLPYMVIDGNLSADVRGYGEVETRRYTRGTGNDKKTYYDADIYQIGRTFDFTVDDLITESADERSNMDTTVNTNNVINAILPFDVKNAVKFNANYFGDFTSEKRDLNIKEIQPRVGDQFLTIARAEALKTIQGYSDRGVRWEDESLDVHGTRWVSVYLPIWLYSYFEESGPGGKPFIHYIAVNARNGKTMGSVPVNKPLLFGVSLGIGLATFVATGAIVLAGALGGSSSDDYDYNSGDYPVYEEPYDPLAESERF